MTSGQPGLAADVRRMALVLGALYWGITFITGSFLWGMAGTDPVASAVNRLIANSIGALFAFGIAFLLYQARQYGLFWMTLLCFLLSIAASAILSFVDYAIYVVGIWPQPVSFDWTMYGRTMLSWTATIFGWSCLFVSLVYSLQLREQERRLALSREEALSAQMRALRYQVHPHFLFNTLNSVAALIEERAMERAQAMVMSLSDFLHETLWLDPMTDVRLGSELGLQARYLDIERERFPDRIRTTIAVSPELEDALVPSLILQPLVENAVKHGIGGAPSRVEIMIGASRKGEMLIIVIENDLPIEAAAMPGMGIGITNVVARLRARFGEAASCEAGLAQMGRYRVTLTMPFRTI